MKVPVPQDWDGQWQCVQIRWPRSEAWRGVLLGLLYAPSWWHFWDADTGDSLAARDVGLEIFNRNVPLRDCAGEPIVEAPGVSFGGLGAIFEEYDEMPCLDLSSMLKMENGVLYALDNCCNWVAVGSVALATQDIGDTPLDPSGGETPPTYYACGKAKAVMDTIYAVAQACWNQIDEIPLHWASNVQNAVGIDLENKWIYSAVGAAILLASEPLDLSWQEVGDEFERQQKLCQLVALFSADADSNLDDATYQQVKAIAGSGNLLYRGFYHYVVSALGQGDIQNVAKLGATDALADCDCPDPGYLLQFGPDANGWYMSTPFTGGMQSNTVTEAGDLAVCFMNTLAEDAYGVAFKMTWSGATAVIKRMGATFSPDCAGADKFVWGDTSDHIETQPKTIWLCCAGNAIIRDLMVALFTGYPAFGLSDSSGFPTAIETPGDCAAGQTLAGVIYTAASGGASMEITEVRWLHNTNSPSHA